MTIYYDIPLLHEKCIVHMNDVDGNVSKNNCWGIIVSNNANIYTSSTSYEESDP